MSDRRDAPDAEDAGRRAADTGSHTRPGAEYAGPDRRARDRRRGWLECPVCQRDNPSDARFCAGCGHQFGADMFDDDDDADPLLGRIIADRYRIEELLGRGGMGVVYRVEHVRIGKLMAMKLLHGALARENEVVKRFKREAEAISRLDHRNTVQIFDFGQSEGMMYLVMEYLPGRDLGVVIKEDGPLPFSRVARIAAQVCGSVAQAHRLGIIHRDLKPENLMLMEQSPVPDFVKVLDFGLAKLREHEEMAEKSITRAGSILGTPYYMAPEHIRGEEVDARSDIYAMGALMYKAVAGVPPFWATTPVGVLTMHLTDDLEPPSQRAPKLDIPPVCDAILCRTMEKDPDDRYQSMDELRDDLLTYLSDIGELEGLESARITGRAVPIPTKSGRQREVATRGDVDHYEKALRRKSLAGYAIVVVLLAALGGIGWRWWVTRPVTVATTEQEPNDELVQANDLPEGHSLTGYLGRRLDERRSDADIYLLRNPGGERRVVAIEVTGIPNMDITFELYREGITISPLLVADSGGIGQPERVPNFVIDGPRYYLRVRELWESGRTPMENVSDPYEVSWHLVEPEEDDEREVNDSVELAGRISMNGSVQGYIGWGGDVDVYCLEDAATDIVARVEGITTLDLILERVNRVTARVSTFDDHLVGQGEITDAVPRTGERGLCFEISAHRPKEGLSNSDERYVLHIEHSPEDGSDGGAAERE